MNEKKLYKSRDDKLIGGVCGGIGEFLNIDSIIIRLVAILLGLATSGILVLIYILLCFLIPYEPIREYTMHSEKFSSFYSNGTGVNDQNTNYNSSSYSQFQDYSINKNKNQKHIGIFLIIIGVILFLGNILPKYLSDFIVPVCLLVAGLLLIISTVPFKQKNKVKMENISEENNSYNDLNNDGLNNNVNSNAKEDINEQVYTVKEDSAGENKQEDTKNENDEKGEFTVEQIKKMREEGSESHE